MAISFSQTSAGQRKLVVFCVFFFFFFFFFFNMTILFVTQNKEKK